MQLKDVDKLILGRNYEFTVIESHRDRPSEDIENTYTGEYRGEDREENYLLFWLIGDSAAQPFHYREITSIKSVG